MILPLVIRGESGMDNSKKAILITGTTGLVGSDLYSYLGEKSSHIITGTSRRPGTCVDIVADLSKADDVRNIRNLVEPDIIVHTAAISKTDYCEQYPALCYSANVTSTMNLHDIFPDVHIIFFSTYAVYNTPEGGCDESCAISPTNQYIQTKIESEKILKEHVHTTILRPSVIFGYVDFERESKNYFMQLLDNIRNEKVTKSPVDQYFNPVYSFEVAEIIRRLIIRGCEGVYNIGSDENISKYEFNRLIIRRFGFDEKFLEGIDSRSLNVARPKNGTISVAHIQKELTYRIPPLPDMIENLYQSFIKKTAKHGITDRN